MNTAVEPEAFNIGRGKTWKLLLGPHRVEPVEPGLSTQVALVGR